MAYSLVSRNVILFKRFAAILKKADKTCVIEMSIKTLYYLSTILNCSTVTIFLSDLALTTYVEIQQMLCLKFVSL